MMNWCGMWLVAFWLALPGFICAVDVCDHDNACPTAEPVVAARWQGPKTRVGHQSPEVASVVAERLTQTEVTCANELTCDPPQQQQCNCTKIDAFGRCTDVLCQNINYFPNKKDLANFDRIFVTTLRVNNCKIKSITRDGDGCCNYKRMYDLFTGLGRFEAVEELHINYCNLDTIDDDVFTSLGALVKTLNTLNVSNNRLTRLFTIPSAADTTSEDGPHFVLDASNNKIPKLEMKYFRVITHDDYSFNLIEKLDFTGNPIEDLGGQIGLWDDSFVESLSMSERCRARLLVNDGCDFLKCDSCSLTWLNNSEHIVDGYCYNSHSRKCQSLCSFIIDDIAQAAPDTTCKVEHSNDLRNYIIIGFSVLGVLLLFAVAGVRYCKLQMLDPIPHAARGEQSQQDPEAEPLLGGGRGTISGPGTHHSMSLAIQTGRAYNEAADELAPYPYAKASIGSTGSIDQHMLAEFVIPYSEIVLKRRIGSGGFGEVFHGVWHNTSVAVKRLFPDIEFEDAQVLRREAAIMSKLRHPKVVLFVGVCVERQNLCIVQEYFAQGSVGDILFNFDRQITWQQCISIAMDAAEGMEFLHSRMPPIIHCDLRCSNLMIDEHMKVKVGDFGMSRVLTDHLRMGNGSAEPGATRWLGPELLQQPRIWTLKADVYSFGVLLWELVARNKPFAQLKFHFEVMEAVKSGQRPDIPRDTVPAYAKLMIRCWHQDPDQRPLFPDINAALNEIKVELRPSEE